MECVQIDLNNVCRTCKNESPEMKPLCYRDSESGKENPRLDKMLMACANVQVSNEDALPKSICSSCFVQLTNAYSFREQCEKTDLFLRDCLKNLKKESVKEEIITDLEFTSTFISETNYPLKDIGEIKDDKIIEDIEEDPDSHSRESREKIADYDQVVDSNPTIYESRTCSKPFYTLEDLRCHKRIHTGKTFKCKQCDKSFTRLYYLHRHELSHGKRKVHVCKICNKTLTRIEYLRRHLVTHLKEKPFGCPTCNRGFNSAHQLQRHIKCCKGEMYICDVCNKGFNREDSLEVHKRLHENKLSVLPTLENLDNIQEHYMEIDFDDNTTTFSDQSDGGGGDDLDVAEENMESEVKVSEYNYQEKIDEIAQIANEIYAEEEPLGMLIEEVKIEEIRVVDEVEATEEEAGVDNGNEYKSDASTHSEYLSTKRTPPKVKHGQGRSRKHPATFKPTGRPKAESPENEISNFPCPQCKEVFTKMSLLEKHAEQHDGLQIHECDSCNKKLSTRSSLKRHKLLHVKVKPLARHKASIHNIGEGIVGEKKYKCQYCQKGFTIEKHRDSHMKVHFGGKKFQCKTCEKAFITKSRLTKHMKYHGDGSKEFLCTECGKRFIHNDTLVVHMRRHRGEKPFKCKFCGRGFAHAKDLRQHEVCHTGQKKNHACVTCGKGFRRPCDLTVHMRIHTGEKPYRCTCCDAAFAYSGSLKDHIQRHTGEIFQCELCSETFLKGYMLKQHKRVVHGPLQSQQIDDSELKQKPFKCKQCDKSYTRSSALSQHELSHGKGKMHVCKICNKILPPFGHLKRHLATHLKVKPFSCPACNRGFNRAELLQNHGKCCKGEKVYICDICNKGFNSENSLEVHKPLHENEFPVFLTLENLDNAEEHYMEIDFDDNTTTFSDQSDAGGGDDLDVAEETMESEVKVSENNDQEKIDEIAQIANEIYAEEDQPEMLIEKAKIEEEVFISKGIPTHNIKGS